MFIDLLYTLFLIPIVQVRIHYFSEHAPYADQHDLTHPLSCSMDIYNYSYIMKLTKSISISRLQSSQFNDHHHWREEKNSSTAGQAALNSTCNYSEFWYIWCMFDDVSCTQTLTNSILADQLSVDHVNTLFYTLSAAMSGTERQSELSRLQEREATLTHLLIIERERRIKAESLYQTERLGSFQLGHKLTQQQAIHSNSGLVNPMTNYDEHYCSVVSPMILSPDRESISCSFDFNDTHKSEVCIAIAYHIIKCQQGFSTH